LLKLDKKMTQELLNSLGEIPAKYSMGLISSIQTLWNQQNPQAEETVVEDEVVEEVTE
jgi:hypothetical protein